MSSQSSKTRPSRLAKIKVISSRRADSVPPASTTNLTSNHVDLETDLSAGNLSALPIVKCSTLNRYSTSNRLSLRQAVLRLLPPFHVLVWHLLAHLPTSGCNYPGRSAACGCGMSVSTALEIQSKSLVWKTKQNNDAHKKINLALEAMRSEDNATFVEKKIAPIQQTPQTSLNSQQ